MNLVKRTRIGKLNQNLRFTLPRKRFSLNSKFKQENQLLLYYTDENIMQSNEIAFLETTRFALNMPCHTIVLLLMSLEKKQEKKTEFRDIAIM